MENVLDYFETLSILVYQDLVKAFGDINKNFGNYITPYFPGLGEPLRHTTAGVLDTIIKYALTAIGYIIYLLASLIVDAVKLVVGPILSLGVWGVVIALWVGVFLLGAIIELLRLLVDAL